MHMLGFVLLGSFWGLSPSAYKYMGLAGIPITHVVTLSGLAVGLALWLIGRLALGARPMDRRVVFYGLGCGTLINIPFALQIWIAPHLPASELALVVSTAPFWNYAAALLLGLERANRRRLVALAAGFLAGACIVVSRSGMSTQMSWWTLGAFSVPVLYSGYNLFTARYWPKGADVLQAGAAESIASGLVCLPLLLVFDPFGAPHLPNLFVYWSVAAISGMWVIERIVYFTLIRDKGPVYTVQAVYVATPAGVLWGVALYRERPDMWLAVSLALIMTALWLNNSAPRRARTTQPVAAMATASGATPAAEAEARNAKGTDTAS